jgi:hypothetical protein
MWPSTRRPLRWRLVVSRQHLVNVSIVVDRFAPTASTPDGRNVAHLGARVFAHGRLWQATFLAAI